MSKTKNVVNLFERSRKKVPELALDIPTKSTTIPQETVVAAYVLPQDRPKLILVIGSGGRGKSLVLRYIAEEAMARDGMTLATLAPNRTLKHYFPETAHPEGNSTSAGAAFLEMFFDVVAENQSMLASTSRAMIRLCCTCLIKASIPSRCWSRPASRWWCFTCSPPASRI